MWPRVLVSGLLLLWLTTAPATAEIKPTNDLMLGGGASRASPSSREDVWTAVGPKPAASFGRPAQSPTRIELAQASTTTPATNAASPKPYTGVTDAYKKVTDTAQAAKEAQAAYRAAWDAADAANFNDPALNAAKSAAFNKWAEALDAADIAAARFDAAQAAYDTYSEAFETWDKALDARDANPADPALEEAAEAAYDDYVKARKTAELIFAAVLDMTPPGIIIQSGSAEFCSYNPGQPPEMTPVDDPRDEPTPDGDDPGDAPPPDGDDPRDQASDNAMVALAQAETDLSAAQDALLAAGQAHQSAVAKTDAALQKALDGAPDQGTAEDFVAAVDAAWNAGRADAATAASEAASKAETARRNAGDQGVAQDLDAAIDAAFDESKALNALEDAEISLTFAEAAYAFAKAAKEALDDPRDEPTPDGDDPRDQADGDDPKDQPDGDDPRDRALDDAMAAVAKAQAAYDDAAAHALDVRNAGGDGGSSDLAAWEAAKALKAAKAAKAALDDPGEVTIQANKATPEAQASTGQAVGRTQVKALAPDQTNVALPGAGEDKPQTGASADPMHCTTGADGSCTLHGSRKELGLPSNTPNSVNVAVADPAVKSFNLEVQQGTLPIGALTPFVTDTLRVGDQSFITVTAPEGQVELLQALIDQQPDVIAVEENICGDKEPAGLMPGCPVSAFERGHG